MSKENVTAIFPGIGPVQVSKERALQILKLQKIIRDQRSKESLMKKDS